MAERSEAEALDIWISILHEIEAKINDIYVGRAQIFRQKSVSI